jgi:chaperonin cofactor prefoldin
MSGLSIVELDARVDALFARAEVESKAVSDGLEKRFDGLEKRFGGFERQSARIESKLDQLLHAGPTKARRTRRR